jgi:hypothetical protein
MAAPRQHGSLRPARNHAPSLPTNLVQRTLVDVELGGVDDLSGAHHAKFYLLAAGTGGAAGSKSVGQPCMQPGPTVVKTKRPALGPNNPHFARHVGLLEGLLAAHQRLLLHRLTRWLPRARLHQRGGHSLVRRQAGTGWVPSAAAIRSTAGSATFMSQDEHAAGRQRESCLLSWLRRATCACWRPAGGCLLHAGTRPCSAVLKCPKPSDGACLSWSWGPGSRSEAFKVVMIACSDLEPPPSTRRTLVLGQECSTESLPGLQER